MKTSNGFGPNIAIVWQPHFNSNCLRVAINNQLDDTVNYIIVCASPRYNGIYKWYRKDAKKLELWKNGKLTCICVPLEICTRIYGLDAIKKPELKSLVLSQQKEYCKKYRVKEQDWLIK